jgi:peptidoglycan/LPS O-acetylase OafA/YrhL
VTMRRRSAPPEDLWRRRELALAALLGLLGSVGLIVCWWGASGERTFTGEKHWLIGAVAAAAVLILGAVYPLLVGFRRMRDAKDDAVDRILAAVPVVATHYLAPDRPLRPTADLATVSGVSER